jgi:tripartite-type tricarboxylate transporter receptor subunit TctC
MKLRRFAATCAIVTMAPAALAAQSDHAAYPSRPIRMIAPSSPGGPADVIARAVSQGIAEVLGQQIVIDNRAGAAGLIGTETVATATPDGYTMLFGFSGPLAIAPHLAEKKPYDTRKDFAAVSLAAEGAYILLAHPSLPVNSVKELVALAKTQPGKLNYASGGNGTGIHLTAELFKMTAGVDIVHVPYKGAGPGQTALLANEVSMMFNGLPPALPHVKSGKLKGLAVAGAKRSPLLPDMPTLTEAGTAVVATGWYGIVAPKGTPRAIVAKVQAATAKACASPVIRDRLANQGVETVGSTPEEFAAWLAQEWTKWEKVIKAAGIKAVQ